MTALPDVVIEAWENREGPAIFATVDEDGTIRSYGDVYGHTKRLIELLHQ